VRLYRLLPNAGQTVVTARVNRIVTGACTMLYRGMDRAQLDAAYNNSAVVPERDGIVADWAARSAKVQREYAGHLDLVYRETPRERLRSVSRRRSAGADPSRLYVAGHSAGGHLTAMTMPLPEVRGGIAISDIYDLQAIRQLPQREISSQYGRGGNATVRSAICRRRPESWWWVTAPWNCPNCAASRSTVPGRGPNGVFPDARCRWMALTTSRYWTRWRDPRAF
jgi:hypothetical protein